MCKALIPHLQARADRPRGTRYTCTPRVLIPRALIGPSTQKDRKAHACAPRSIIRALRRTLTCTHHLQPHRTPPRNVCPTAVGWWHLPDITIEVQFRRLQTAGARAPRSAALRGGRAPDRGKEGGKENPFPDTVIGRRQTEPLSARTLCGGGQQRAYIGTARSPRPTPAHLHSATDRDPK